MDTDIESILPNKDFPDYTAFSANVNPLYFQYALPFLTEYVKNENTCFAAQDHFEELVGCNNELQMEYVEWYNSENEFYVTSKRDDGQIMDIYILARYKKVLMFFTRKAR